MPINCEFGCLIYIVRVCVMRSFHVPHFNSKQQLDVKKIWWLINQTTTAKKKKDIKQYSENERKKKKKTSQQTRDYIRA